MPTATVSCPSHTLPIFRITEFRPLAEAMAMRVLEIKEMFPEVEAIAGSGHSGNILGGAISFITGLPYIAVRKHRDTAHDERLANGAVGARGYIIIDDLVSTGKTLYNIVTQIAREADRCSCEAPTCVGVLLYEFHVNSAESIWLDRYTHTFGIEVVDRPVTNIGFVWSMSARDIKIRPSQMPKSSLRDLPRLANKFGAKRVRGLFATEEVLYKAAEDDLFRQYEEAAVAALEKLERLERANGSIAGEQAQAVTRELDQKMKALELNWAEKSRREVERLSEEALAELG